MKQLLIMMVALTLGATSCQKANVELEPDGPNVPEAGNQVEVMLNLSVAPTETATTKGADTQTFTSDALDVTYSAADDETTKSTTELTAYEDSRVANLWVLQFNKSDGKLSGTPVWLSGVNLAGIEVGIPLKLTAASATQVIYVVANTGSSSTFSGANVPADEAALNERMWSVGTEYRPNSSQILMLSRIEVPKVDATTTILSGTLERMFAKVKLNLKNEFPDFEVGYVQLKNVAANFYYRTAQTGSVNWPVSATNSHIDYGSEPSQSTLVYYVPENLRTTTGTVNSAGERTLDKTDGMATYIEIMGRHTAGTISTQVTYCLPLGDVATSVADFNVRRNHTYTLDVTLKGANTVDQRITVAEIHPVTISPVAAPSTAAPANCFMVSPGKTLQFDARIRGNGGNVAGTGLATTINPTSVALVWEDVKGLITNASAIPLEGGVATVTAKSGTYGNAVVAAYDGANGTGNILWSWHIWVTDYNLNYKLTGGLLPNRVYTDAAMNGQVHTYGLRYLAINPGKVIMDRNLGATQTVTYTGVPTAADAPKAFGQVYQWGRKDPMGQGLSTSNNFAPWYNAAGTSITPAPATAGPTTLQVAYQNPTKFYYNTSGTADWLSTQNNNLWGDGGAKTIFDPCPAGWKVPRNGTWYDFTSTGGAMGGLYNSSTEPYTGTIFPYFINGTQQTANGTPTYAANVRNGRLYQQGSVKAWYPVGGVRVYSTGNLGNVGGEGDSWSSSSVNGRGYFSLLRSSSIAPSSTESRAYGFTVRCIQE